MDEQERAYSGNHVSPVWRLDGEMRRRLITGLPGKPSHNMGYRSSESQSGHPGEGKDEGLVRRNDVLTNGFIGFYLA